MVRFVAGGMRRRLGTLIGAIALATCVAPATDAFAETRTATIDDGADPGVRFDVQQVRAVFNREARTLDVTFRLNNPLPADGSSDLAYMVAWVSATPSDESAGGCDVSDEDAAGDTYINIDQGTDGNYTATVNVKFRREYNTVAPTISADRHELTVHVSDELYTNSNPRCLSADSEGQGAYDPSKPDGGPSSDSLASAFFDGYGPPGTRWAPKPQCSDGLDNDHDGAVDLQDPQCDGDPGSDDEAHFPPIPALTHAAAIGYARKALLRKFGSAYRHGSGRHVGCRRVGRLRQRCNVSWFAGDVSWSGTVGIWYARDSDGLAWNYNMRIVRKAVSCGRRGCKTRTHVIRVR